MMKVKGIQKNILLKTLSIALFGRFNGKFTKKNIIIVIDSAVKNILNNFENVLLSMSWSYDWVGPFDTFMIDMLLPWLQKLYRS